MADAITVQYTGDAIVGRLRQLADALEPGGLAPFLRALGEPLVESTKRLFVTSTGPDGRRWAPNAQATYLGMIGKGDTRKDGRINARATRRVAGKRPLVESGQLADTIVWQVVGGSALEVGTNRFADEWDAGAAVHQFGSRDGHIPARPFLGLSDEDEAVVVESLDGYLQRLMGG